MNGKFFNQGNMNDNNQYGNNYNQGMNNQMNQPNNMYPNMGNQPMNNNYNQPMMNNNFNQGMNNQMGQPMMNNNYNQIPQQPMQQPMMNNYNQSMNQMPPQQPMMNNNYNQPMMDYNQVNGSETTKGGKFFDFDNIDTPNDTSVNQVETTQYNNLGVFSQFSNDNGMNNQQMMNNTYDQYNQGYDQYNQGYDQYDQGYDQYDQGYDNYDQGYDQYNQGYDQGYDNYNQPMMDNNYNQMPQQPMMDNNYNQMQQPMMNNNYNQMPNNQMQQPMMNNNFNQGMTQQFNMPNMGNQNSKFNIDFKKLLNDPKKIGIILGIGVVLVIFIAIALSVGNTKTLTCTRENNLGTITDQETFILKFKKDSPSEYKVTSVSTYESDDDAKVAINAMEDEIKNTKKDAGVKNYDLKRNGKKVTLRVSYDVEKAFKDQDMNYKKAKEQLEDRGATCK